MAALADGRSVTGDALVLTGGARSVAHDDDQWTGGAPQERAAVYRTVIPMEMVPGRWQDGAATSWVGAGGTCPTTRCPTTGTGASPSPATATAAWTFPAPEWTWSTCSPRSPDIGYAARNVLTLGEHWRAWTVPGPRSTSRRVHGRVALVGDTARPARPPEASGLHHALADAVGLGESWDASGTDALSWLADYDTRRGDQPSDAPTDFQPGPRRPLRTGDAPLTCPLPADGHRPAPRTVDPVTPRTPPPRS